MNLFVTGTDTGVGKTYVSTRWVRSLRAAGRDAVGFKPICCGDRDDAEALAAASDGCATLNEVNPIWLRAPAAPYVAAMMEERMIDLDMVLQGFETLRGRHQDVIVEGAGGWNVPIRRDYWMRDLAKALDLPVLVVAANRLGAINHTLLTVESVTAAGLRCAGVILSSVSEVEDAATITNRSTLEAVCPVPVLLEVHHRMEHFSLPEEVV